MFLILTGGFILYFEYVWGYPVFDDVPPSHPAHAEITYLAHIDIIGGFEDNTYRPDLLLTREYFTAFIIRTVRHFDTLEVTENTNTIFTDVPINRWSNVYITNAVNLGIINADDYGNRFMPHQAITIGEAVLWVMRIIVGVDNIPDINTLNVTVRTTGIFSDVLDDINAPMTRAQAAVFIKRMIDTFMFEVVVTGEGIETHTFTAPFGHLLLDALPNEPDAVQPSYRFDGWFLEDGTRVNNLTQVEQNITVTTRWSSIYSTITIINEGSPTETITPRTGGLLYSYLPPPPERSGYRFVGWFLYGGNIVNEHMQVVTDITVVARWNNLFIIERNLWTLFGTTFEQEIQDILYSYHPRTRIMVATGDFDNLQDIVSYSFSPDNTSILFTTSNFLWRFTNRIEVSAVIVHDDTDFGTIHMDDVIFIFTVYNSLWIIIIALAILIVGFIVRKKYLNTLIITEKFDVEIRMRERTAKIVKPEWIFIGRCSINPPHHEKLSRRKFTLLDFNRVCVAIAEDTKQAGFKVGTFKLEENRYLLTIENQRQFELCTFEGHRQIKGSFIVKTPKPDEDEKESDTIQGDDSKSEKPKKRSFKEKSFEQHKESNPKLGKIIIFKYIANTIKHVANAIKHAMYMRFDREPYDFANVTESISFEVEDTEIYEVKYTLFKLKL